MKKRLVKILTMHEVREAIGEYLLKRKLKLPERYWVDIFPHLPDIDSPGRAEVYIEEK